MIEAKDGKKKAKKEFLGVGKRLLRNNFEVFEDLKRFMAIQAGRGNKNQIVSNLL